MQNSSGLTGSIVVHNRPEAAVLAEAMARCSLADRYRILGLDFALAYDAPAIRELVYPLFAPFAVPDAPTDGLAFFYVLCRRDSSRPYRVVHPEGRYVESDSWKEAFAFLVSMVHAHLWAAQPGFLPIHGAAASCDGKGVIMPGASGSGKTTLVLELALNGFAYLSDEFAPLDLQRHLIVPFARPMQVSGEALRQLLGAEAAPILQGPHLLDENGMVRYLLNPAERFPLAGPCRVDCILFPVIGGRQKPQLEPLSEAEALQELANLTLVYHADRGWRQLAAEGLVALVREAAAYRLFLGPMGTHAQLVRDLIGRGKQGEASDFLDRVRERIAELLR